MDSLEEIAYTSAERALDKQERVLEELRARTGLLLAASSLTASLLGREAFGAPGPPWLVLLSVAAFVVSLAASLYVLLPRGGFVFSLAGAELFEELYEVRHRPGEIHRRLAYQLQSFWVANNRRLRSVVVAFRFAAGALAVEVLSLASILSGTLL